MPRQLPVPSGCVRLLVAAMLACGGQPLVAQCTLLARAEGALPGVAGGIGQAVRVLKEWDPDGTGPALPVLLVGGDFAFAGDRQASSIATYDPANGSWKALGSGILGDVRAIAFLPGYGLVVGGHFTTAGGPANNIARWNGTQWLPLGAGLNNTVYCVAVLPNGDVVAGGVFNGPGGNSMSIARWNGTSWAPLGGVIDLYPSMMIVMSNGDLVAAGNSVPGWGQPLKNVARWDGTSGRLSAMARHSP